MDLGVELGDPVLDHLAVGQRLAVEGDHAGVGALAHHVEGPLRDAEPAHAVVDPAGTEAFLGDHEPVALGAEQVRLRYPARLVDHLGVARVPGSGVAHHADVAHEIEARACRSAR